MATYPGNAPPSAPSNPPPYGQPSYGQPGTTNKSQGDSLMGQLTTLGKGVGSMVMGLTKAGVNVVSKALQPLPKDWMKTGSVVQLVAKSSGRALQILQAQDGRLVLDGLGGEGQPYFNAHFTVFSPEPGVVLFHNNCNYLTIDNGMTQLYPAGPSGTPTPKCRFRVRELILGGQFFIFESDSERGKYLSVMQNGMIKSALVTKFEDQDSQFAIRAIYTPPPATH